MQTSKLPQQDVGVLGGPPQKQTCREKGTRESDVYSPHPIAQLEVQHSLDVKKLGRIANLFDISVFSLRVDFFFKNTSSKAQIYLLPLEDVVKRSPQVFHECGFKDHGLHTVQLQTKVLVEL